MIDRRFEPTITEVAFRSNVRKVVQIDQVNFLVRVYRNFKRLLPLSQLSHVVLGCLSDHKCIRIQRKNLTDTDQNNLYFDVRQSVRGRNITRLLIAPLFSVGLILFGMWLVPEETIWKLHVEAIETWNVWSVFGVLCVGFGLYGLLKELVFAIRAYATTGEWHFRLTDHELLWHVPHHVHGKEEGFKASLEELREIEFKTIQKHEDIDEREYWVHFNSRGSIQLKSYSGVSLSWLVEKISATGVPFKETFQTY